MRWSLSRLRLTAAHPLLIVVVATLYIVTILITLAVMDDSKRRKTAARRAHDEHLAEMPPVNSKGLL